MTDNILNMAIECIALVLELYRRNDSHHLRIIESALRGSLEVEPE